MDFDGTHILLCAEDDGILYKLDPITYTLHKIDTTSGNYLSSEPWCLGFSLGMTLANNHVWVGHYDISGGAEAKGSLEFFEFGVAEGAGDKIGAVGFLEDSGQGLDVGAAVVDDWRIERSNCAKSPIFTVNQDAEND